MKHQDKSISLKVNEQELFELIMVVYASGNTFIDGQRDKEVATRRRALLDKLHVAYESRSCANR